MFLSLFTLENDFLWKRLLLIFELFVILLWASCEENDLDCLMSKAEIWADLYFSGVLGYFEKKGYKPIKLMTSDYLDGCYEEHFRKLFDVDFDMI